VFEKSDRPGGLLRYGIPDFKMEKRILDRRLDQLRAEGVKFETDIAVGVDLSGRYLQKSFDAICLAMGAGRPRLLGVPGAELDGLHLAMDFLTQQNRRGAGDPPELLGEPVLSASGKNVVVIGGGDTGSDCVGTAIRQGALSVAQLEILPQPPEGSNPETPWPGWPNIMRSSSSQQEGCQRRWSVLTKSLSGASGHLTELHACEVDWVRTDDRWQMQERPDTDFTLPADMILLAMGFLHVEHSGLVNPMGLALDASGNIAVEDYMTSVEGIFAAGDAVRGASLVVHAINSGRQMAAAVDRWLK
jgi:NADPH-dependent glutamate synthase beta subunit-like oxidoreductase